MTKKIINLFCFGLAILLTIQVSAQCENVNGNFESFTGPVNNNTSNSAMVTWINDSLDNWFVSHGAPVTLTTPTTYMSFFAQGPYSEGVYTNYSFVAGKTYELTYKLWMIDTTWQNAEFRVELSNGLTPDYSGVLNPSRPSSAGNQSLTIQPWKSTGLWHNVNGGLYVVVKKSFTASQNYSQLWFHPVNFEVTTNSSSHSEYIMDDVCIKTADSPCDVLEYAEIEVNGTNPYTFNVQGLPSGYINSIDFHWELGDGNTSTSQNLNHTYAINTVGVDSVVYPVCLSVYNFDPVTAQCCSEVVCTDVTIYLDDFTDPIDDGGGFAGGLVRKGGDEQTPYFESGINYEIDEQRNLGEVKLLEITPSATDGNFQIHTQNEVLINDIVILTLTGKEIYRAKNNGQGDRLTIDLNQYDSGYYLIIVNENDYDNRQVGKVVLK
ncbi:MAG: hypothetical protein RIC95_02495 [Vicingaceae bacterium]